MKIYYLLILLFLPIIAKTQVITTFAGCGSCSPLGDGGPATLARLDNPVGVVLNSSGDMFVASGTGKRIRKISVSGIISTFAGTGTGGYTGDGGLATAAQINYPHGMAIDTIGNIFFTDVQNYTIRKIDISTGIITTICGTGMQGYTGDGGPASAASLYSPTNLCFDKSGNLYITENGKHVVRMINTVGVINTIAGTGINGFSGDGLSATLAQLYFPESIAIDDTGSIYISDAGNSRIRKISTAGVISTFAGNGVATFSGNGGPYSSAQFTPAFIKFDKIGNLYLTTADDWVAQIGTDGIFRTVAGNGVSVHAGDGGSATAASMSNPLDIVFDDCANLYISASSDNRIRKVSFNPTTTPSITITGVSTATVGATVTVNAAVSGAGSVFSIKWFKNSTLFSTTSTPTTTYIKGTGTDTITARVVPAVTTCYDSAMSVSAHLVSVGSVGVQHLTHKSGTLHLHPNPAQHTLAVSCDAGLAVVSVVNIVGAEVARQQCAGATAIKLSVQDLPPGMYVVHATATDGSKIVERFVKE